MSKSNSIDPKTRNNWFIDAVLFSGAVMAALTGVYFLFLPVGGYQGGRNPMHGVTILFGRHTWEDLHTWFGILMLMAAAVHITLHWRWFLNMFKRMVREMVEHRKCFNNRSRLNLGINFTLGLGFTFTAISGLYFFFIPGGRAIPDPHILFSRTIWDLIHTWAGILMIAAATLHFAIHWKWVTKVTRKIFKSWPFSSTAQSEKIMKA
jgi:hypothetical protein